MLPLWAQLLALVASPIFAAGATFAAVRITLAWHLREIERAHRRLDLIDERLADIGV